jgi:hypothetical protein
MDNQRREVLLRLARLIARKHRGRQQAPGNEQLPNNHFDSTNADQTLTDDLQNNSEWQDAT